MSAAVSLHEEADSAEAAKSGVALSDLSGMVRTAGLSSASQTPRGRHADKPGCPDMGVEHQ